MYLVLAVVGVWRARRGAGDSGNSGSGGVEARTVRDLSGGERWWSEGAKVRGDRTQVCRCLCHLSFVLRNYASSLCSQDCVSHNTTQRCYVALLEARYAQGLFRQRPSTKVDTNCGVRSNCVSTFYSDTRHTRLLP